MRAPSLSVVAPRLGLWIYAINQEEFFQADTVHTFLGLALAISSVLLALKQLYSSGASISWQCENLSRGQSKINI